MHFQKRYKVYIFFNFIFILNTKFIDYEIYFIKSSGTSIYDSNNNKIL